MKYAFLTPLLAAALAGCSFAGADSVCTLADADSQVEAVWRPADFGGADAVRIRLCVDGTCQERTSGSPGELYLRMGIRLPDGIGASTVAVRLTVTSTKSGDTVVRDSTRVKLTEGHPNGTACPPTVWTASFGVHPDKGLTSSEDVMPQR
jgi:hypothetical protein